VKFGPIGIECARKSLHQFANAVGYGMAHLCVSQANCHAALLPLAEVCAEGAPLPQTFGVKSLKIGAKSLYLWLKCRRG